MLLSIRKLLSEQVLQAIEEQLAEASFISGKATAGSYAQGVKENLQVDSADQRSPLAGKMIIEALQGNQPFLVSVRPKHILAPLFSRYDEGMEYGRHLDNPIMGRSMALRTDVSVTIFLNSPAEYEGGELVIDSDYGPVKYKGDRGDAVVYPSTSTHRVSKVTGGQRRVAVTWVQSMIRSAEQRRLLFDLAMLERNLKETSSSLGELAERCHYNLFRMWAEP